METSIRTSRRTRRSHARRLDDRYRSIRLRRDHNEDSLPKNQSRYHPMYTSPYYDRPITRTQRWDILPAYVSYTHAARSFCSLANVNVNKRKQSNAGAETTSRRIFKVKKKNRRHHDDDASGPPGVAIDTVPSTRPNSLPHLVNGTTNAQSAERTSTSVSSDTSRVG